MWVDLPISDTLFKVFTELLNSSFVSNSYSHVISFLFEKNFPNDLIYSLYFDQLLFKLISVTHQRFADLVFFLSVDVGSAWVQPMAAHILLVHFRN